MNSEMVYCCGQSAAAKEHKMHKGGPHNNCKRRESSEMRESGRKMYRSSEREHIGVCKS